MTWDLIMMGLENAVTGYNLLIAFAGTFLGVIIGAFPGLSATMGIILMLPLTYKMALSSGLIMLLAIYSGAMFGGSVAAIMVKIPGTPSAAATLLDGPAFAEKGEGCRGILIALIASFIGGILSSVALMVFAPALASVAIKFFAQDFFALGILALSVIASVSNGKMVKSLIASVMGLFFMTIGTDATTGYVRFTFGTNTLLSGIDAVPAMLGMFAIPDVIDNMLKKPETMAPQKSTKVRLAKGDLRKIIPTSLSGSVIGTFIGAVPGTGAGISAFLNYNLTRNLSKEKDDFGKGSVQGVAASESANNATAAGTLIPLLTLGIPGDVCAAIMLGAFISKGIQPGPLLFVTQSKEMYTLFTGAFIINIFMLIIGIVLIKLFIQAARVPMSILTPIIFMFCIVGTYSINNSFFDMWVMLAFGVLGYIFNKISVPLPGMLIAMTLSQLVETNFRRAIMTSKMDFSVFFTSPICLSVLIVSAVLLVFPIIMDKVRAKKAAKAAAED